MQQTKMQSICISLISIHKLGKNMIIMARAESINIISMPMSQMDIAIKHKITTPKSSMCYDHSSIEEHKGKVFINRLIKCHICFNLSSSLTLYFSLMESSFCGPRIFAQCLHTRWRNSLLIYLVKILFFGKNLESPLIFVLFFFKQNKIRKKTINVTSYLEKTSL